MVGTAGAKPTPALPVAIQSEDAALSFGSNVAPVVDHRVNSGSQVEPAQGSLADDELRAHS